MQLHYFIGLAEMLCHLASVHSTHDSQQFKMATAVVNIWQLKFPHKVKEQKSIEQRPNF